MIGKLFASVVEGVLDVADIGVAAVSDVVKSPIRAFDKLTPAGDDHSDESFAEDLREAIERIKDK